MYSFPVSPGVWIDQHFHSGGRDIISLKLHLAKILGRVGLGGFTPHSPVFLQEAVAQFQPEATEQSVVDDLVRCFGIDLDRPSIEQPAGFNGWSQAPWVSASSPRFYTHPEEPSAGVWPASHTDWVPFIGQPCHRFEIRDARERVQQIIGSWPTTGEAPLLLSFTLWQKDHDPLHQRWRFGRSSFKTCPYGLSSALASKDATIVIDDDLSMVDGHNRRIREKHGSAPPLVFVAWPRGLYRTRPEETDWTQLRGRRLQCAVENNRESVVFALQLKDELLNAGADSIEFVLPKRSTDGQQSITVDYQGGELRGDRKSIVELQEIAENMFGISSKLGSTRDPSTVWKIGDRLSSPEETLLMRPWPEKGTINLVYSDAGVGKSYFAILMMHALATGGKLFDRFSALGHFKCLYLAGETAERICRRVEDVHLAFPGSDAADNIEVYPPPNQNVGKLNLECAEDWQKIGALTAKADVIVIDHLTAFTVGHNSPESWSRFHLQLRRLTQQGKTILILHHAGKSGQQRGTSILDADIDMKIHMKRLDEFENGALVTFEKHRDDETMGKALQPFQFHWKRGSDHRLHWWVVDAEPSETKSWAERPDTNNECVRSVDESFIQANFDGRKADIIRCLARAVLNGKPRLQRQEIDRQLDVSSSTALSLIGDLVAKGSIFVEGKGKATRYALSGEMAQSIIHE